MISKTLLHKYETVITTAFNRQPRRVFLALLSGARNCFGFADVPAVYDDFVIYDMKLSVAQNNLNSLLPLDINNINSELRIYFSGEDYRTAFSIFKKTSIDPDLPICILITQTSGGQPSDWWPDRFAQLADQLHRNSGLQVVFVGSKSDVVKIEKIRASMIEPSVSIAGLTDIPTLAAVMCISDVAVTVDTGPMHIGTAVGLPMILVASAWQSPHEWLPVGSQKVTILRSNDISCKECYKAYCATRECMEDIGVRDVYSNVVRKLAVYPPSAPARLQRVKDSMVDAPRPKLL
ncbi:MAG: glycosyltransferase family 9 protein [Metallibacterium scheffleri]|jgi:ADP-heptose:LPS heptosyltransferase|uniref:glycosyltransferase family 9 protein n=1 Tax=Metallibacterium scheffleri TaxID=993689 RepID=UPI0026F100C0|nr:glycosyltransferase family 9 protein [Metallibacterium scheffleri]MCK9367472.1 glycosyltransferase family 9 protein [Metallibacterium scheffleri]